LSIIQSLKNIFSPHNRLTDEKMWDSSLWRFAGNDVSGENINEYSALNYSAVYNAVTLISGTIGSLPLHLFQSRGKTRLTMPGMPLYRIMHDAPNEYMTAMQVRESLMAHALLWGNGYAEIVRDQTGAIWELWPIPPNRVRPMMSEGRMVYEIRVDGQPVTMERENILHIAGLGFDGFVGYSVVRQAATSIGLGKSMETFGARYFGAGTHPGVIVSHPAKLTDAAHKNLKDSLVSAYSGLGQSHRLMLLEEGMKLEKLGVPPNDSQFLESRQFQITDIARWFNIPVHKLKEMSKSSFNNIESEQQSFVTDTILPWCVRLEQSYNQQLLNVNEYKSGLYFKHVLEGLLRGSAKDRAEFYSKLFNIGAMTINEIRGKEDLNPVEGGDIHLVPLNMTTLKNAGRVPEIEERYEEPQPVPEPDEAELQDRE
jgi:HK97 family phage portal protein